MLSRSLQTDSDLPARAVLRERLLAERERFAADPRFAAAAAALTNRLLPVLHRLEPQCIGWYWPVRGEFNAAAACRADAGLSSVAAALPFARLRDRQMHYRRWDGSPPRVVDECGIASSDGAPVTPDVVVVPCVGFSAAGFRLGYGGGYFDRWIDAHPQVVAIGVAWSFARVDDAQFAAAPHDRPLALVVTEEGVVK